MTAAAPARPAFDEGEPPSSWRAFATLMRPESGRMANTLLVLAQVAITLTLGEIFRLPQLGVFVWITFLLSSNDAATTLTTAPFMGGMLIVGTILVILFLSFSLSEAALRLPIMFALTLAAGYLSRAMTMGPLANVLLFWIVYMSTNADLLEQVGFSIDATVGNTTDSVVPDAAFLPPEEAMVHVLLWTALIFVMALSVLIAANLAFGRDPAATLRRGLAVRLQASAQAFEQPLRTGGHDAGALHALARQGVAPLRQLQTQAAKLHRDPVRGRASLALVRDVGRLVLIACEWKLHASGTSRGSLTPAVTLMRICADILTQYDPRRRLVHTEARHALDRFDLKTVIDIRERYADDVVMAPMASELARVLDAIATRMRQWPAVSVEFLPEIVSHPRTLLKPDAVTNPEYLRAAVRLGLSVAICYGIMRLTDWQGISTCIINCFLISLGTVGDSVMKMTMRITGALVGAVFGIGAILLLMPAMTDLWHLLALVLPVLAVAAWVKFGSARIADAGVQMALAFLLCVLQGYGPTLNMEVGRDRIVGMMLANIVVFAVSATLWPVSVADVARRHLVRAVRTLGRLATHARPADDMPDPGQEALLEAFGQAIADVRGAVVNDRLDPGTGTRGEINIGAVTQLQRLAVPLAVLTRAVARSGADAGAHDALAAVEAWFDDFAEWIVSGRNQARVAAGLTGAARLLDDACCRYWAGVLDARVGTLLTVLLPDAPSEMEIR